MTDRQTDIDKRSIVFLVVVTAFFFSLFTYLVLAFFIPQLPCNEELYLEGRKATQCEALNIQTVADASFQQSFEKYASDALPIRDEVLLTNAYVQRSCIRLANCVFSYENYPTYYGSAYIHSQKDGRINRRSYTQTKDIKSKLSKCVQGLNDLGKIVPGKLVFCLPARMSSSKINPTYSLMNKAIDEDYIQKHFFDNLDKRWNVYMDTYDSIEEYSKNYFYSDHHWNINGAVKNYERIMGFLERKALNFSNSYEVDYLPGFHGASARRGADLDGAEDHLLDVDYENSELLVTVNGEEKYDAGFLDESYEQDDSKKLHTTKFNANIYIEYFHDSKSEIVIENPSCDNQDTLLLVADSFADCMDRFFAESYGRIVYINPRTTQKSLSDVVSEYNVQDCLSLLSFETLINSGTVDTLQRYGS